MAIVYLTKQKIINQDEKDKKIAEEYGTTEEMIKAGASEVWKYPIEDFNANTAAIRIFASMKNQEISSCRQGTYKVPSE